MIPIPADKNGNANEQRQLRKAYNHSFTLVGVWLLCIMGVAFFVYYGALRQYLCVFQDDSILLMLWPLNEFYLRQLGNSNYSHNDICFLIATNSTISVIGIGTVVSRVLFWLLRGSNYRDPKYIRYSLPVIIFVTLLGFTNFLYGITGTHMFIAPSIYKSMTTNVIITMIFMYLFYVLLLCTTDLLLIYLRSRAGKGR
jgi:hypothetical protein